MVYNLTDVPTIVSGPNVVIFDPHTTLVGRGTPVVVPPVYTLETESGLISESLLI